MPQSHSTLLTVQVKTYFIMKLAVYNKLCYNIAVYNNIIFYAVSSIEKQNCFCVYLSIKLILFAFCEFKAGRVIVLTLIMTKCSLGRKLTSKVLLNIYFLTTVNSQIKVFINLHFHLGYKGCLNLNRKGHVFLTRYIPVRSLWSH